MHARQILLLSISFGAGLAICVTAEALIAVLLLMGFLGDAGIRAALSNQIMLDLATKGSFSTMIIMPFSDLARFVSIQILACICGILGSIGVWCGTGYFRQVARSRR